MSELQRIAKLGGKSFEEILQEERRIAAAAAEPVNEPESKSSSAEVQRQIAHSAVTQTEVAEVAFHAKTREQGESSQSASGSIVLRHAKENEVPITAMSYANSPEVQRMVVEHVVRSEAPVSLMSASFRLRQFSGKTPCPTHEADFDTWRNSVELILRDPALSDLQ